MNTELFWEIRQRFDNVVCQKVIRQIWDQFGAILDHWGDIGGLMWGGVYCVPLQHCQSSGSLIPHKTWFQMSNTPNIQLPWLTNLIQILCHWALQGSRKWHWWSKWSRFGTAGVQEIPICGVYNALNISGNHPWCFFWYLGPNFLTFGLLVIFYGLQKPASRLKKG